MKILDIGCGAMPLFVHQQNFYINGEKPTEIGKEFEEVRVGDSWVCLDNDPKQIRGAKKNIREIAKKRGDKVLGKLKFVEHDAKKLPFEAESFQVVALSDVLTVPYHDWCMDCDDDDCKKKSHQRYEGLPEADKVKLIKEGIRVLEKGGRLIISNFQTLNYARESLGYIKESPNLRESNRQENTWFNEHTFETRGFIEIVFVKN